MYVRWLEYAGTHKNTPISYLQLYEYMGILHLHHEMYQIQVFIFHSRMVRFVKKSSCSPEDGIKIRCVLLPCMSK